MSNGDEENQSEQDPGTSDDDPSDGFDTRRDIGSLPGPESPEPEPSEGFETIGLLEGDASEGFPTNIEVKGLDHVDPLPEPSEGFEERSEG